jgi:hypothetical protein
MAVDTRKSLEDEVLALLDESNNTGVTRTNVRNALAQAHAKRLSEELWPFMLWHTPQTFNLVAAQQNYVLHSEYARPLYFKNLTRGIDLRERPMRHLIATRTAEDSRFVLWNRSPVRAHPAAASVLTIVSANAGDTGATRGFYVRGETADGVVSETIQANGTSPVVSANAFLPGGILQLVKFGVWSGKATVTSDSGATTNLVLLPEETGRSYQQIRLLYSPSAAESIEYQFFRTPSPLNYDESVPDIPYPHSKILVYDTLLDLLSYDGQLDSARFGWIKERRDELDLAMRQAFIEGQSLLAEPQQVIDLDEDL